MARRDRTAGANMLSRLVAITLVTIGLPVFVVPMASAEDPSCPSGTSPVSSDQGVICVVVNDPGKPGSTEDPGEGSEGVSHEQGCFENDGSKVPCVTSDGTWWSGSQCYAAPYDAPPGSPAWQGQSEGSLWQCSRCDAAEGATTCNVEIIWTPPGAGPGPPTPGELAARAVGLMPLATADLRTAPHAPDPTYVGVDTWMWVPESQWSALSKTVRTGDTSVTVRAEPTEVVWDMGPESVTCPTPGTVWKQGMTDAATTSCSYTYDQTSKSQPDEVFTITATIRYQVDWTCAGACSEGSGSLGVVDAPVGSGSLRVLQRQTVVVR